MEIQVALFDSLFNLIGAILLAIPLFSDLAERRSADILCRIRIIGPRSREATKTIAERVLAGPQVSWHQSHLLYARLGVALLLIGFAFSALREAFGWTTLVL